MKKQVAEADSRSGTRIGEANMTTPRSGMVRFEGNPTIFYVAICEQCKMALPFGTEKERSEWMNGKRQPGSNHEPGHLSTGHTIKLAIDVRPDAAQTEARKNAMVAALREKYARPAKLDAGPCSNPTCSRKIVAGERMVSYAGKFYHAECVDDAVYLRLANIIDVMPGLFDSVAPVTMRTWMPGENNQTLIVAGMSPHQTPAKLTGDPLRKHQETINSIVDALPSEPKKMNARERRRLRRKDKQWKR